MGAELFRTAGGLTAGVLVLGVLGGRTARRAGALGARFSRASTRLPVVIRAAVLGVFAAILATACSAGAAEDKRVALVIGNGAYLNAPGSTIRRSTQGRSPTHSGSSDFRWSMATTSTSLR